MGVLETILIVIGVCFIIGSFLVSDRLSDKDVEKLAVLSEAELKVLVDRQLREAKKKIEDAADEMAEETRSRAERLMEKECNEKIMAISEYSDTVLEAINKTHNDVVFLYSMLNDKYTELTKYVGSLSSLKEEIEIYNNQKKNAVAEPVVENKMEEEIPNVIEEEMPVEQVEAEKPLYHRDNILDLYRQGMREVEIARTLGLGIGEVRLVIELYKKEQVDEV